jgi:uncharacterized protein (UPF0128 family)
MTKLKNNISIILKNDPDYRRLLSDSIGIGERAVIYNLQENKENGTLTKYNALCCIKNILHAKTLEELLTIDMQCK